MRSRILLVFLFGMLCLKPSHSQDDEVCEDLDENCYRLESFCDHPSYEEYAKLNCPVTCKNCPSDLDPTGLCLINRGDCGHDCTVEEKHNKICTCYPGYTLTSDKHNCTDVDECSLGGRICLTGHCENLPGGFECQRKVKCSSDERPYFNRAECCKKEPKSAKCGVTARPDKRIVGGKVSFLGQWPWQVYINIDKSILCGGTLISNNWVVTAGHCFREHSSKTEIRLYFGVLMLNKLRSQHVQERKPKRHVLYPGWDEKKFELNDIALIETDKPVKFTNFVRPVCLPNGEKPKVGVKCYAAGWGLTDDDNTVPSNKLQYVDLPIVDNAKCTKAYRNEDTEFNSTIMTCAGYDEGGKDACRGDSGGPLVCQRCDSCGWYLAGVVSFGSGCAAKGFYGVYVDVPHFEQWISDVTSIPVTNEKSCDGPYFSKWSAWSACTKTCGKSGTKQRVRECMDKGKRSSECSGSYKETDPCERDACPTLGKFEPWSACTETCGGGVRTRLRKCLNGKIGEDGCPKSESSESEECNTNDCPFWGDWSQWNKCTTSCGKGDQMRERQCRNGAPGDEGCRGDVEDTRLCNEKQCPGWSTWESWSTCPVTCGGGKQTSKRTCNGGGCVGSAKRDQKCNDKLCPTLGEWEKWSSCDATCGGGNRRRSRSCTNGKIGDIGCEENKSQQDEACNTQLCPEFSSWSKWGVCSKSCGGGTQEAIRTCKNGKVNQKGCEGPTSKSQDCSTSECIGKLGQWSEWSVCSESCGNGKQKRERPCNEGTKCIGVMEDVETCKIKECPVFGDWTAWEKCSKSCGGGKQSRSRECLHTNNPSDCNGNFDENRDCNQQKCPGEWRPWTQWTSCDVTCGVGQITRRRTCKDGEVGEPNCDDGSDKEVKTCKMKACPSRWGKWKEWSECSKDCDRGIRSRTRPCVGGKAGQGDCVPLSAQKEEESCNEIVCGDCFDNILASCSQFTPQICEQYFEYSQYHCPRTCNFCPGLYEHWGNWEPCSSSCGAGVRTRNRVCKNERIGCEGSSSDSERCQGTCRGFDEWSSWTQCIKTCGGGKRTRSRTCSFEKCNPDQDGNDSLSDEETCNKQACPGVWGSWGKWGKCSQTCGRGAEETRSRKCRTGKCDGDKVETRRCRNIRNCPGVWADWTQWSQCSAKCGKGTREKTRQCKDGVVGEPDCLGKTTEKESCDAGECFVAAWGLWSKWGKCNEECMRSRDRACDGGSPGDPGCEGDVEESEKCDTSICEVEKDGPCDPSLTDNFFANCDTTDTRRCFWPAHEADCAKTCCKALSAIPCEDIEDSSFNCVWYLAYCDDIRYEDTFRVRCRKTCKFCTP